MQRDGGAIHSSLDESAIIADIDYFEAKLRALADEGEDAAMRRVYQSLLTHRRRVLAAWRDGHPDRWFDYEPG